MKRLSRCFLTLFLTMALISVGSASEKEVELLEADTMAISAQSVTYNDGLTFDVTLTGRTPQGTVFAALYRESGQMTAANAYPIAETGTVTVSFEDVENAGYAKIFWFDDRFKPRVPAEVLNLSGAETEETATFEDFADAISSLTKEFDGFVAEEEAESNPYAFARLIVRSNAPLPNLREYGVARMVRDPDGCLILQFREAEDAEKCAEYLKTLSGTVFAEPDSLMKAEAMETEAVAHSWGVAAIHADAYAGSLKERGVTNPITVAVVDTGVDAEHSFLQGRLLNGYDFVDNDRIPQDGNSHGTHVAGTVVDCTPNLTNIKIMPVRVLNNRGSGTQIDVTLGIRYAVDHGANVINLSLGGSHNDYVDYAIAYAVSEGVTVAVAAGNGDIFGNPIDTRDQCPAHITDAITVAAVDSAKERARFSNYGDAVDIAAPGVSVNSAIPGGGYASKSGTSMATPHVAAACALLLSEHPDWTPAQVEGALREAATDLGASGWDRYYGAGFLNLQGFVPAEPEPEPEPQPEPSGDIYAVLYADGELVFQNNDRMESGRTVTDVYKVDKSYSYTEKPPWHEQRESVTVVTFVNRIAPRSTAYWFYELTKLTEVKNPQNLDTANVTDMYGMFKDCSGLISLDVSGFNTSNVTDMRYMFYNCHRLKSLDVSGFDTSKVTSMGCMFYKCGLLASLDVSNFDTSNVTNMRSMFNNCHGFTSLDLSGFNTANVTDMGYMFNYCTNLRRLDVSGFDTSNVTDMGYMFAGVGLASLDVSGFNTANVTYMGAMFYSCSYLTSLDLSSFDTRKVGSFNAPFGLGYPMFGYCRNLKTIYVSGNFVVSPIKSGEELFRECTSLVGGAGTKFDSDHIDKEYARIDGGPDAPGYFTRKP